MRNTREILRLRFVEGLSVLQIHRNREVLAIEIDLRLSAQRVIRVLEGVVAWRGFPAKLRMDNGSEFISSTWTNSPPNMNSRAKCTLIV